MSFGFQQPYPTKFEPWGLPPDGLNWRLLEPLIYKAKDGRLIRTSVGTLTDGLSTPREVWNVISPVDYWMCAVLHDAAFKDTIELYAAGYGDWNHYTLDEDEANALLDEALESRGCGLIERTAIYDALKAFGKFAFNDDRAGTPKPTPTRA